jgi:hypothetical protein
MLHFAGYGFELLPGITSETQGFRPFSLKFDWNSLRRKKLVYVQDQF